jgi:hypothetical protein
VLFGRSISFPYRQATHTDHFVGWRYLINGGYRKRLHQRWSGQSRVVTVVEVFAGTLSSLFFLLLLAGLSFLLIDQWL